MDLRDALSIADKVSDKELSWAEHPSMINMIYALEVLAADYRTMDRKAEEWQTRAEAMRETAESANDELDRTQGAWSDLMEFIRSALNLDVRALDDAGEVRTILGRAFADARLWARVKELAAGNFRAGDVVTADALNAFSEAVMTADGPMDAAKAWPPKGYTTRVLNNSVWLAPEGTDPRDHDKWTHIGWANAGGFALNIPPAAQHFPIGSPEPPVRVKRVTRPQHSAAGAMFVRAGALSDGSSLWRRVAVDNAPFLRWSEVVRHQAAVEA